MTFTKHHWLDDAQAVATGALLFATAIILFRQAGLLIGGTAGLSFLAHYGTGWSFSLLNFLINIPFYIFGLKAIGKAFTLKTFCAVALLSIYIELMPHWFSIERIHPLFAAILGGLLAGAGLLMLVRHQSSLGGLGTLAIYLQKTKGWRAGKIQMIADGLIVAGALCIVDIDRVILSIIGACMLNLVLTVNHRPGRYFGQ